MHIKLRENYFQAHRTFYGPLMGRPLEVVKEVNGSYAVKLPEDTLSFYSPGSKFFYFTYVECEVVEPDNQDLFDKLQKYEEDLPDVFGNSGR